MRFLPQTAKELVCALKNQIKKMETRRIKKLLLGMLLWVSMVMIGCKDEPGLKLSGDSVCYTNAEHETACVPLDGNHCAVVMGDSGSLKLRGVSIGNEGGVLGGRGALLRYGRELRANGLAVEVNPGTTQVEWVGKGVRFKDVRSRRSERIALACSRGLVMLPGADAGKVLVSAYGAGGCEHPGNIGEFMDLQRDTVCEGAEDCFVDLTIDGSNLCLTNAAGGGLVIVTVDPTITWPDRMVGKIIAKADPELIKLVKENAMGPGCGIGGGFLPLRMKVDSGDVATPPGGIVLWNEGCSFRNEQASLWGCGRYLTVTDPNDPEKVHWRIDKYTCLVRVQRNSTETRIVTFKDCAVKGI